MRLIFQITFVLFILGSCSQDRCFNSIGDPIAEVRTLGSFDRIDISDHINLFIDHDSVQRVEVRGGENLLPNVITQIDDGTLQIFDQNTCNWMRSYDHSLDVYVSTPELKGIYCSNTGDIIARDTIVTRTFQFDQMTASGVNQLLLNTDTAVIKLHTGTGDMTCIGRTNKVEIYSSSYGYVDCTQLPSKFAIVTTRSSGDVWVNSSSGLEAYIESEGNIHLQGGATKIRLTDDGSGALIIE